MMEFLRFLPPLYRVQKPPATRPEAKTMRAGLVYIIGRDRDSRVVGSAMGS